MKILSLDIPQSMDALDPTRAEITDFFKKNHITDDTISSVDLALYETLVNIIDHAPEKYRTSNIKISCKVLKRCIRLSISNLGEEFDITKVKLPDIVTHYKSGRKRGLGIYFIRTLMDEVEYTYKDQVSTIILTKFNN